MELGPEEAVRLALASQGFGGAIPRGAGAIGAGPVRRVVERLGVLQIDGVAAVARAHYLPVFSRLGAYDRGMLDAMAWGGGTRRLVECWGHEASLLPVADWKLLGWRRREAERGVGVWTRFAPFAGEKRPVAEALLERVAKEGRLAASMVETRAGRGSWWDWGEARQALEWLFRAGKLAVATRRPSFEREYDLPERVLPRAVVEAPELEAGEARRELVLRAARALGVGTAGDLADWFRLRAGDAKAAVAELVEAGELAPVRVRGWEERAFVPAGIAVPRRAGGCALLAPFDPLVWCRPRVERLWGLRLRIEIYVPAARRVHGYYVLPFLCGTRIAALVDVRAERRDGVLAVPAVHALPGAPRDAGERLAGELRRLAGWLGVERVRIGSGGGLLTEGVLAGGGSG